MNKYIVIGIAAVVVAVAVFFAFRALPQHNQDQLLMSDTQVATSTATTSPSSKGSTVKTSGSVNQQSATTPAGQNTPVSDPALSNGLKQAFATQGSYRCQWVDKTSGADSLALIKNGRVRLESTPLTGSKTTILYTGAATYMWKEGERTGVLVPKNIAPTTQLNTLPAYSDLEAKLRTDPRVKCEQAVLSDVHFTAPTNITFQAIPN